MMSKIERFNWGASQDPTGALMRYVDYLEEVKLLKEKLEDYKDEVHELKTEIRQLNRELRSHE